MGRSGYSCGLSDWETIKWRGRVASAIRGNRGQMLLQAIRTSLLAMEDKRLIPGALITPEGCCTLGATAKYCSIDVSGIDPYDIESVACAFGISDCLIREISYVNDDDYGEYFVFDLAKFVDETPERRYTRMLNWVESKIQ